MKEYIIQDLLNLNLNGMMEYSYQRPPKKEVHDIAVAKFLSS